MFMSTDNYYIGQICLFPYSFVPSGFLLCDGKVLQVSEQQVLYALLGDRFGGDAEKTYFQIPNMSPPMDGMAYYICIDGIFPTRD
jgi:microcystin-dependent protein